MSPALPPNAASPTACSSIIGSYASQEGCLKAEMQLTCARSSAGRSLRKHSSSAFKASGLLARLKSDRHHDSLIRSLRHQQTSHVSVKLLLSKAGP